MELWNKIVHDLKFCKANNVSEDEYQKEIERILELLGWWRMGARKSKSPIPWGSAKDLLPDIQLFKNEKEVLVIEIKRPHNILSQRQIGQLDSYMHSLKLPVGLYIGEKQLFIRFCGCNLNCNYCDTNFKKEDTFPVYNLNVAFGSNVPRSYRSC